MCSLLEMADLSLFYTKPSWPSTAGAICTWGCGSADRLHVIRILSDVSDVETVRARLQW